jgi:hypothetical protein
LATGVKATARGTSIMTVDDPHPRSRVMTAERAHAYQQVLQTIAELGPSKLLGDEQDRIRSAADSLLFSRGLADDGAARAALEDAERLCRRLVDTGRWEQTTAMRLADAISRCGPALLPELRAA